ncbi:MAG: subtilase family N-terminal domain-containing protein, partial [Bacteroidota bacterium]
MRPLRVSSRQTNFTLALVVAILSLSFSEKTSPSSQKMTQARRSMYLPGEVIIKFKLGPQIQLGKTGSGALTTGIASLDKLFAKFQGEELKPVFPGHPRPSAPDAVDLTRFYSFRYRDGSEPKKVAKVLQSTGVIEYAEPRFIRYVDFTPNDLEYPRQWYLRRIQADKAWDVTKGDTSVIIGIDDTGVDWRHPDLKQNIWHNPHPGAPGSSFPADSIGCDFGG